MKQVIRNTGRELRMAEIKLVSGGIFCAPRDIENAPIDGPCWPEFPNFPEPPYYEMPYMPYLPGEGQEY